MAEDKPETKSFQIPMTAKGIGLLTAAVIGGTTGVSAVSVSTLTTFQNWFYSKDSGEALEDKIDSKYSKDSGSALEDKLVEVAKTADENKQAIEALVKDSQEKYNSLVETNQENYTKLMETMNKSFKDISEKMEKRTDHEYFLREDFNKTINRLERTNERLEMRLDYLEGPSGTRLRKPRSK